jgi:MSHA biogenesis protein MshK
VRLGERYGESRLVKLSEREAVLDGPNGIERLRLTPDVEKTNVVAKRATKTLAPRRAQGEGR